ncbi:MAG: ABC transporter substrate-binding protein [Actinobacteria bacterium]|nr:ABC transporter substrate-binding protein [Actinomycetota bacterium]
MSALALSRRRFLRVAGGAGISVAGVTWSGASLVSCSSGSDDTVKVGVIAPFSGPKASTGELVTNSLEAAVRHLNSTGGLKGRKAEVLLRDAGAEPASGARLYGELSEQPGVVGVLWCGAPGFDPTFGAEGRPPDLPVVAVFEDPSSRGTIGPGRGASSLFQMDPPANHIFEALADYARRDRGYSSAALLHDGTLDGDGATARLFEETFARAGIDVRAIESYTPGVDYVAVLERLATAAPEVLFLDGVPEDAADIVTELDERGASYVDTPTTKGPTWRPHIFGSPRTLGDGTWVDLAGGAAKIGTVTGGHVGGLVYLPSFEISSWMQNLLGKEPTGGEDLPADAMAIILRGTEAAGSADSGAVAQAMRTLGPVAFASLPVGFSADRQVAYQRGDVVIRTLERLRGAAPTTPPYELGREWSPGNRYDGAAAAFTQLVRPTLEANRGSHPEVMAEVLAQGYGTQCTKQADGTLSNACKIH